MDSENSPLMLPQNPVDALSETHSLSVFSTSITINGFWGSMELPHTYHEFLLTI